MEISNLINVSVWPSHGANTCLVSWEVDQALVGGDFYVYRSPDGVGEWKLVNDAAVAGTYLEDTGMHMHDRSRIPHWRVLCEKGGKSYDSAVVGLFEKVSRRDCGTANVMRQTELRRMKGNGVKALYYPARIGGLPCNYVDSETGSHLGDGCANTEKDCYGTGLIGGYRKPLVVWIELYGSSQQGGTNKAEGVGQTDKRVQQARILAAFVPQIGDMVVLHATDDRFLVDASSTHKLRGIIPVVSDVPMSILPRNHEAYRLPRIETLP